MLTKKDNRNKSFLQKTNASDTDTQQPPHSPHQQRQSQDTMNEQQNNTNNNASSNQSSVNSIKEGTLWKRGGGKMSKAWKQRWFSLPQNDKQNLFYYKEKTEKPKGSIHLVGYNIELYTEKKKHTFMLVPCPLCQTNTTNNSNDKDTPDNNTPLRTWYLAGPSQTEMEAWIQTIKQYTLHNHPQQESAIVNIIEQKLESNSYNINPSDLEWTEELLGKGGSGIVKKGLWLKTTEVAIKALNNLPEFIDMEELKEFYQEIEMLSTLRHPNIVSMIGYCKKANTLCLVIEYISGGSLDGYIFDPNIDLDLTLQTDLCISFCRGMVYLHSKNILHRDLKPGNILVDNLYEGKIKVCDFGLSKVKATNDGCNNNNLTSQWDGTPAGGSPGYAAPELATPTHTSKVDVFSFGVIMWEIFTRCRAWQDYKSSWEINSAVREGKRPNIPADIPPVISSLIQRCWDVQADKRPSFNEIYEELLTFRSQTADQGSSFKGTLRGRVSKTIMRHDDSLTVNPHHGNGNQSNGPTNSKLNTNANSPEGRILAGFRGRESLPWEEFAVLFSTVMNADMNDMQHFHSLLVKDTSNVVLKERFEYVFHWFTPLAVADEYLTDSRAAPVLEGAWKIDDILDIISQTWFFGFLSTPQAKKLLANKEVGTFLFRFSGSEKGWYALSAVDNNREIVHWRISCEKHTGAAVFKIDGKAYSNLHQIIETHTLVPLSSNSNTSIKIFLRTACNKNYEQV